MKKCLIGLLLFILSGVCMGQELRVSTALPPDSLIVIRYYDGLHQVQRELELLTDPADEWSDALEQEGAYSETWQRHYGRQKSKNHIINQKRLCSCR